MTSVKQAISNDVGDMAPEYVVDAVIFAAEDTASRFHAKVSGKVSHDLLFAAMAPTLVEGSLLSRSATSLMGSRFYPLLATQLAQGRFGVAAVPRTLASASLEVADMAKVRAMPTGLDVHIWTRLDRQSVEQRAADLQRSIKTDPSLKIGSDRFRHLFRRHVEELWSQPLGVPWVSQNDFALLPQLGIVEMESGGQLDSSNVQSQVQKLIRGGLAYGDADVQLHWALAYANQGEGAPPLTPLSKYLTYQNAGGGALLVGGQWWEALLPSSMTYGDLVDVVLAAGRHFSLSAPEGLVDGV